MPVVVLCPSCSRHLQVPDDLFGALVRCPSCRQTFTARIPEEEPVAAYPANEEPEMSPPVPHPVDRYIRRTSGSDDRPGQSGPREMLPHRGPLILVLGILSIILCGVLGPIAWILASNDLKEIRAGRMDPEGEGTTQAGRICAIIGTVCVLLQILSCCGLGLMHRV